MRKRLIALTAAAALLGLAGCGGDDDAPIETVGETTTEAEAAETVSKQEFISSADARCAEANAAVANLAAGDGGESLEVAADQEEQITSGVLDSLESLGTPEDPSGALDRYLGALEDQVAILRKRANAARSGDTAAYEQLTDQLEQAEADARDAASEYGFKECGQEGSALEQTTPDSGGAGDAGSSGESAPAAPATPAPVAPAPAPAPPTGGTGGGTGTGGGGTGTGGGSGGGGGESGGVGPG